MIDRAALNALLRCDFESFVAKSFHEVTPAQTFLRNWHHAALAWHLEQCRLGKCRRLIITLPPRQLKSIFASVALPAFTLGHDPTARIICVSYSSELSANFAAQYQQTPIPVDGEIVRWEWFRFYETEPARGYHDRIVQSWDTASKSGELNDYSVCTTWLIQNEVYYLLDVFRKRLNYPELRRAMIDQAARWSPSAVLIEDKASGTALAQDIRMGELKGAGLPIRMATRSHALPHSRLRSRPAR